MTGELRFHNLTLGYERHPAVHHLERHGRRAARCSRSSDRTAPASRLCSRAWSAPSSRSPARSSATASIAHEIAYLPQVPDIDRTFPINVYDMVAMGLWRTKGLFGGIAGKDRHVIEDAIAAVGLTGFEQRAIGTLSGGQMQRMLFARLLIQDARVIVLDEPFTAIDDRTAADLLDLVRRWHGERRTVLAALHDIDLVKANFPETLLLAREPVAWGATREVLTPENLNKARLMCEAFDESAEACAVAPEKWPRRDAVPVSVRAFRRYFGPALAGRHSRAGARRRPDRRVPDAAPHESDRRRDVARHLAGRCHRLSRRRTECLCHDARRPCRRSSDCALRRRGQPGHHLARGCVACGVSSGIAGASASSS